MRQWPGKLTCGLVPWEAMLCVGARGVEQNTASHGVKPRVSHLPTDVLLDADIVFLSSEWASSVGTLPLEFVDVSLERLERVG